MIVRTWNLFHGNTNPPGRKAYLREMVELSRPTVPTSSASRRSRRGRCRASAHWAEMQLGLGAREASQARAVPDPGPGSAEG